MTIRHCWGFVLSVSVAVSLVLSIINTSSAASSPQSSRCGRSWVDANSKCGTLCPSQTNLECGPEICFAYLDTTPCTQTPPPPPVASPPTHPVPPPTQVVSSTPKFVTYIDSTSVGGGSILQRLGVPSESSHSYNVINLAFWLTGRGPLDAAYVWANLEKYVPALGSTAKDIQLYLIGKYHDAGIKVLVSAFGATDNPTPFDPVDVATKLAKFVITNHLDGVDLDYEDSSAFDSGIAEYWLCTCTNKLRDLLPPPYVITHAPQAPYFRDSYRAGGYKKIDATCGSAINWYNVQFYNQGSYYPYDSYRTLFESAEGTSVGEIVASGVSASKIVIGKGVSRSDLNTGFVEVSDLKNILREGVSKGYTAGFMGWQFSSDSGGTWSNNLASVFPHPTRLLTDPSSNTNAGSTDASIAAASSNTGSSLTPLNIGLIVTICVLAVLLVILLYALFSHRKAVVPMRTEFC